MVVSHFKMLQQAGAILTDFIILIFHIFMSSKNFREFLLAAKVKQLIDMTLISFYPLAMNQGKDVTRKTRSSGT